ncbi:DUF6941 family protein [Nonomuraea sp. NPDC050790]|uniref:DUF6941 family protein n=1 Tax=Nonomuraea sp. NPDC050790 TaxID=3364371 RepID=UPI0037903B20
MIEGFLVLADSATTDPGSGKVHMLGGGWSITGPVVPPAAIVGFLRIPWDEADGNVAFKLRLIDDNGRPVEAAGVDGAPRPISFQGELALTAAQPAGEEAKGVPMNLSFSLTLPPLPLSPGRVYEWLFETEDTVVASVAFAMRKSEP